MKKSLRQWSQTCFGSIKLKKLALMSELDALDVPKEYNPLCLDDLAKEQLLLQTLGRLEDKRKSTRDKGPE